MLPEDKRNFLIGALSLFFLLQARGCVGSPESDLTSHVTIVQVEGSPIFIPCPFKSSQIWAINGTLYGVANLPRQFKHSLIGLELIADVSVNGTSFQCYTQEADNSLNVLDSPPVTLYVQSPETIIHDYYYYKGYNGHIIVTHGFGGSVKIPCPFHYYSHFWMINEATYGVSNIPPGFSLHYLGLEIKNVLASHNGTELRCFTGSGNNLEVFRGPLVVLNIIADGHTASATDYYEPDTNTIALDHTEFLFNKNYKTLSWFPPNNCSDPEYILQFTLCIPYEEVTETETDSTSYNFSSNIFVFTEGNRTNRTFLYLSAVCSGSEDVIELLELVHVHTNEITERLIIPPGEDACVKLPQFSSGETLMAGWPFYPGSSEYCSCSICDDSDLDCDIQDCNCIQSGMTNFTVDIRNSSEIAFYDLCWLNVTYEMTNTLVYVYSDTSACQNGVIPPNPKIYRIYESAVMLVVGGPPKPPQFVNKTQNGTNGTVCLDAESYDWLPVTQYQVVVLDLTDDIYFEKNITEFSKDATIGCVNIPFLYGECAPYRIQAYAYNELQRSNATIERWPELGIKDGDPCSCVHKKLNLTVSNHKDTGSITVGVNCTELTPNSTNLVVQLTSDSWKDFIQNESTKCGTMESVKFTGLNRSTEYQFKVLSVSNVTKCLIEGPSDIKTQALTTAEFNATLVMTLGVLPIIIMIILSLVVIGVYCFRRKGNYHPGSRTRGSYEDINQN